MASPLSSSAQRVQAVLADLGLDLHVVELPHSTRTAADAARAIGCQVGQIAKSLVFITAETHLPLMVIASGANRVDIPLLEANHGERIHKADAEYVRAHTGFAIGGVPPVGHTGPLTIYLDQDLMQHHWIWTAAGNPRAVFRLTPQDLVRMTSGKLVRIA